MVRLKVNANDNNLFLIIKYFKVNFKINYDPRLTETSRLLVGAICRYTLDLSRGHITLQ